MLESILTTLMKRRGKSMVDLRAVMELIQDEQALPPALRDHPLHGEYTGKRECHVEADWLLIYKVRSEAGSVTFYRTGSHADLF